MFPFSKFRQSTNIRSDTQPPLVNEFTTKLFTLIKKTEEPRNEYLASYFSNMRTLDPSYQQRKQTNFIPPKRTSSLKNYKKFKKELTRSAEQTDRPQPSSASDKARLKEWLEKKPVNTYEQDVNSKDKKRNSVENFVKRTLAKAVLLTS